LRAGRPVAIRVFAGNTADPSPFTEAVEIVRGKFGISHLVMAGDRGMITPARIRALKEAGGLAAAEGPGQGRRPGGSRRIKGKDKMARHLIPDIGEDRLT
jgi:hypothetical protein